MELRMVGLGICFTSCYNIHGYGQECSRGNTINYWSDACTIISTLPRPPSKCGVVRLRTAKETDGQVLYTIRPNLLRAALAWLRANNPLYANITISEDVLAGIADDGSYDEPSLTVETLPELDHQNVNDTDDAVELDEGDESFALTTGGASSETEDDRVMAAIYQREIESKSSTVHLESCGEPMNEYTTSTLMQLCFPSLFPTGTGGYQATTFERRMHAYELAEFCTHLMRFHDRRFVIHRNFKFFCLNMIQRRQVDGLTRRLHQRQGQSESTMSPADGSTEQSTEARARAVLKKLKPYFKSVRGSGLDWAEVRSDLMGMIRNRVMTSAWPTFFFTLSAADTIWPDLFQACDPSLSFEQAQTLPARTRRRLLNENPDLASRHFYKRFHAFFELIMRGSSCPLGVITDYFWRVEFQRRGSPHIHGLLWTQDAPDALELSKSEHGRQKLADFVDKHIATTTFSPAHDPNKPCECCIRRHVHADTDCLAHRPPPASDADASRCDVQQLVSRVQQHQCYEGSTCREKSGSCRFNYPKTLRDRTEINVVESSDGGMKITIDGSRDNCYTNNFNPDLLQTWRANMDLKLIGNAYGATEYTAAYVSKSEPDSAKFRRAICTALERSRDSSELTELRRVANAAIATREVGAQEALWILQRNLPMYGKSRNLLKVKTLRHDRRFYRVDPETCLHELSNVDHERSMEAECDPVRMEPIEAAYCARPNSDDFNSMTFRDFCERFETTTDGPKDSQRLPRWERLDGRGYIKARQKLQAIVKTPRLRVDGENPDYCYSELFLGTAWRQLADLPQSDDDCVQHFSALNDEILEQSLERQRQLDLQMDERDSPTELQPPSWSFNGCSDHGSNTSAGASEETDATTWSERLPSLRSYTQADYDRAKSFIATEVKPFVKQNKRNTHNNTTTHANVPPYRYPIGLREGNMSPSQWRPFAVCMRRSRLRHNCVNTGRVCTPIRMILNGEGGSGKSWLIRHIVKDIHAVWGDRESVRRSRRVLLMAHHGAAAFNIKGTTICSALSIPAMKGNGYSRPCKSLDSTQSGLKALRRLQNLYRDVQLVVIDEYSVVSCAMLRWIDLRLRELWPAQRDLPFRGRDIILAGDMGQLSPVSPSSLASALETLENENQRAGRILWEGFEDVSLSDPNNVGATIHCGTRR